LLLLCFMDGFMLSAATWFKQQKSVWLSKPVADRAVYRSLCQTQPKRIIELGTGRAERAKRMLELASGYADSSELNYIGIDLFEMRASDQPGIALKDAYRLLHPTGAIIQLVPGDPRSALSRVANSLSDVDLLIVSADLDTDAMSQAWLYVPRMLNGQSTVLVEQPDSSDGTRFVRMTIDDVDRLAAAARQAIRHAA